MSRDPVVDEVRTVRDAIAREYDYDVKKLADAMREAQQKSSRKVVRLPPRQVRSAKTAS